MSRSRHSLTILALFISASSLFFSGCQTTDDRTEIVSNASTPVQMLEVPVGSYIDLDLPFPPRHNWWVVESGDRPYLQSKVDRSRGRIRLWAMKPGKTEVVCALRNYARVIRKVVVGVEVKP
ncbi:MAG: hypothetical protein OSB09_11370 [Planctomycetota bacterium]|nr:hypothetical protein [Planctomycetota bacterium]